MNSISDLMLEKLVWLANNRHTFRYPDQLPDVWEGLSLTEVICSLAEEVSRSRKFGTMHHDRLSHLGPGPAEVEEQRKETELPSIKYGSQISPGGLANTAIGNALELSMHQRADELLNHIFELESATGRVADLLFGPTVCATDEVKRGPESLEDKLAESIIRVSNMAAKMDKCVRKIGG